MIFISYRRSDTWAFAQLLRVHIEQLLGRGSVFLDVHSIHDGEHFPEALRRAIESSRAVVVPVGARWSVGNSNHRAGKPDFLHEELALARDLQKPIIPVALDGLNAAQAHALLEDFVHGLPDLQGITHGQEDRVENVARRVAVAASGPGLTGRVRYLTRRAVHTVTSRPTASFIAFATGLCISWQLAGALAVRGLLAISAVDLHNGSGSQSQQLLRAFPTRQELYTHTNFSDMLLQARESFDIVAITAQTLRTNTTVIQAALQRGVSFRVILLDHREADSRNVSAWFGNIIDAGYTESESRQIFGDSFAHFQFLAEAWPTNLPDASSKDATPRGTFEVRLWNRPFLNSFWIRDPNNEDTSLGHVEISFPGDLSKFPVVRSGGLGKEFTAALSSRFEWMWSESLVP